MGDEDVAVSHVPLGVDVSIRNVEPEGVEDTATVWVGGALVPAW
jgi:hypothetical protein